MNHNNIENIIFDLGGVIINLDFDNTFKKFSALFNRDIRTEILTDHEKYSFFREYEVGRISSDDFRNHLRSLSDQPIEDQQIDAAWNAMLKEIPSDRASWIYETTKNYNCVVLSNTNHIHVNYFERFFYETTPYGYPGDIFQKLYYSHEIGERKPDSASFEYVLKDAGFEPTKTLLLDDMKENLDTAQGLGIKTELVEKNKLRKEQLPDGRK